MPTIGNLINPEYYQKDNSNVKNPLSDLGDILLKRQDDNLALSRQKELQKYQLDLENQQIQQNNLRALAEAAAFNERQTKLGGLVDQTNQDKSIYSKASTLADNPSGYGLKIIKPKPAPPTAMMQLASGAFGDVMGNEIPNTQPEVISQPAPTVVKGGRTIPRQVAQMKVGGKGEMSYSIEDNPEFKDLQAIKMKVAEAGGDASQVSDLDSGMKELSRLKGGYTNPTNLTNEELLQGRSLARKLYGVRGVNNQSLDTIYKEMESGKSIDKIEDSLRMSGQSEGLSGDIRNAAQRVLSGESNAIAERGLDSLDDYVSNGDIDGAKDWLKGMARDKAGVERRRMIEEKERTVEFLGEITDDLKVLEGNGINTNIFSGTAEDIAAKIGTVREPELRRIATKIEAAIQNYRRGMTGAAFNALEDKGYRSIFPSIGKTANFNTQQIKALEEIFSGDLDSFYSLYMGKGEYKSLFKGGEQSGGSVPSVGQKFNGGTVISVERID